MTIRLAPSLSGALAARSSGRLVIIDAYRQWSCGAWIGDLTAGWVDRSPGAGYVASDPIEGVPVFVRSSLAHLLEAAGPSLAPSGVIRRDGLRIELERPELWLDWLAYPGG